MAQAGERIDPGGSPADSRGGPHRFKRRPPPRVWCGTLLCVALCSVWGMDSGGDPPQTQEVAPLHVCGVVLYSMWHFILCGRIDSRGGPHRFKRWLIGKKSRIKSVCLKLIFKVCMLWLPRYVRYSIEAKTSQIHKDGR